MTKPAITKRSVKAAALTYNELDTNFQNLADATISIDADGNVIVLDLNDSLTLTPGDGISFSVTGNELTITGTASITGLTNPLTSDLNTSSYKITKGSTGNLEVVGGRLRIENYSNTAYYIDAIPGSTANYIEGHNNADLTLRAYNSSGQVEGSITLDRNGLGITLNASYSGGGSIVISDGVTRHVGITTTQRNALTAFAGMIIFNSTTSAFEGYNGTSWVTLG